MERTCSLRIIDRARTNDFQIPLYEEPIHTRSLISDLLAVRTEQKIKEEKIRKVYTGPLEDLFVRHEIQWPLPEITGKSVVEKYLEENSESLNNPLGEYLKFGGTKTEHSRDIVIIFPKPPDCDEEFRSLNVSVLATARMREVVGYCMLQYYLKFDKMLP